jgi:hypothetical protein
MYLEVHSQSTIGYVQEVNVLEDEMSTRLGIFFCKISIVIFFHFFM